MEKFAVIKKSNFKGPLTREYVYFKKIWTLTLWWFSQSQIFK